MGAHNLSEYGNDIRFELADPDGVYSADVIGRAVAKMESLLARLIPKKNIVETRIMIDRTSQALVINSETGTTDYKPIKYDSESISTTEAAGGTIMVRGTDYNINYMTGVVTKYDTGSALSDGTYFITYKQDPMRLDISSLVTDPVKITRVEYPVGDQPPTYLSSFDLIEDYIIFHKDTILTEGKFLRIYYDSQWTAATFTTDGEYPSHLDDAIIIGAAGQCLLTKAEEYVIDAVDELKLVNASADGMNTALTASNAALNKVAVYLETNTISGDGDANAEAILENITGDAANLRTILNTHLGDADAVLGLSQSTDLDKATTGAEAYLDTGDDKITTLNVADRVAEKYADYARARATLAATRINATITYIREAELRLSNLRSYIEEAGEWGRIANTFIAEAAQRIADVNAWATQADRYATTSREYLNIAGRYLASGQSKINEFYIMIGVKPELAHVQASTSQATKY